MGRETTQFMDSAEEQYLAPAYDEIDELKTSKEKVSIFPIVAFHYC